MAERAPHGVQGRTDPSACRGSGRPKGRKDACTAAVAVGLLYNCLLWVGRVPYVVIAYPYMAVIAALAG
eukprot:2904425-Prymnesium_polylepis.2